MAGAGRARVDGAAGRAAGVRSNRIEATTHEGIPITTPSDLCIALARHRGRRGGTNFNCGH